MLTEQFRAVSKPVLIQKIAYILFKNVIRKAVFGDAREMLHLRKELEAVGGGEKTTPRKELPALSLNIVFDRQLAF